MFIYEYENKYLQTLAILPYASFIFGHGAACLLTLASELFAAEI